MRLSSIPETTDDALSAIAKGNSLTSPPNELDKAAKETFNTTARAITDPIDSVIETRILQHGSRLLDLPAELKNNIYRFTLVEDGDINIPADGPLPVEPGLLRTCFEIRDDAQQIWLRENTFNFDVEELDTTQYRRWCRASPCKRDANITYDLSEPASPFWDALCPWLRAFFYRECGGIPLYPSPVKGSRIDAAACLFEMVSQMRHQMEEGREKPTAMHWERTLKLLVPMRAALSVSDDLWD